MARKKIGVLLEEKGLITEFQLVAALSQQRKWKIRLGKALIEQGYIEEKKLFEVIAEQWGMDLVDFSQVRIPDELKRKIGRDKATALMAVPVRQEEDILVVAVAEPDRAKLKEDLEKIIGMPVRLVLGMDSQVEEMARLMAEKVPVGTVKPVKKAFRKNDNGEIKLVDKESADSEALLGGKDLVEKQPEEPVVLGEEPVPLEEGPVELEEEAPETIVTAPSRETGEEVPDLDKKDPALGAEEKTAIPSPEIPKMEKPVVGEDTDELWDNAQPVASVSKGKVPAEIPGPESSLEAMPEARAAAKSEDASASSLSDYFPGQMRDLETPRLEEQTGPKAEEGVMELGADLPAKKIIEPPEKEPEPIEAGETIPLESKEPVPGFLSGTNPEEIFAKDPTAREFHREEPAPVMREENNPEPEPISKQVASLEVESELSKPGPGDLEKQEILQMVTEIEQKLKRLREMVKVLKEKLES